MDKEIKKKETSAALSAIMKYRDITTKELSAMTDVPVRSIENYRCGRNDMSTSIAKNIIAIEHALDIDGRILTGNKSISDFFVEEDRRLRERKKAEAAAAEQELQQKRLQDAKEMYFAFMELEDESEIFTIDPSEE